ncbi:hypothetical protein AHAS_Ahas12G0042100 [Arachis hypogaea]
MIGWEPPTEGWFKLNVDGSVMPPASMASCSGLIRDCQGRMIAGFMMNLGNCSITLAELWDLYAGIKLARELGIGKLLVETDSLCASNFVQNMAPSKTAGTPLLRAIKLLLAHSWDVRVSHVYKERNFYADLLAKKADLCQIGLTCFSSPPAFLSAVLMADAAGVKFARMISM